MSLMHRRRALMGQSKEDPGPIIPVGVNLYSQTADGVDDGHYITGATAGTKTIQKGNWSKYLITAPMPYNSRYIFYTNATTNNSSGCVVLDSEGIVVFYAKTTNLIKGEEGQTRVKNAEAQLGLKGVAVKCSTIDKSSFIFRRQQ